MKPVRDDQFGDADAEARPSGSRASSLSEPLAPPVLHVGTKFALAMILSIRKRFAGWLWSGTLGAGRERTDHNVEHQTTLAELRAEGTIGKATRLALHASYNRSAGFAVADRYWYRAIGATVAVPF